jgi:pentatricopeptide repeat protein
MKSIGLDIPGDVDTFLSIIKAYAKLGHLKASAKIVKEMEALHMEPTLEIFSVMISASVSQRDIHGALRLFRKLKERRLQPSARIYGYLVAGMTGSDSPNDALKLYAEMTKAGLNPETNAEFLESLTMMHIRLHRLEEAKEVLNQLKSLHTPENSKAIVRGFTAVIDGVLKRGTAFDGSSNVEAAERLLSELSSINLKPTLVTHTVMLYGYYKYAGLEKVLSYFKSIVENGYEPDQHVYNILIRAHVLEELPDIAISIYEQMVSKNLQPNSRLLTSLITAFSLQGNMSNATAAFEEVLAMGVKPDHALFHVVMNGYAHNLDFASALNWYDRLFAVGLRPNVVTYTILMYGISRSIDPEATSRWYHRMFSADVRPNVYTYSLLMHDRARRGEVAAAAHIYEEMLQAGVSPNCVTFTTLMHMYVKNLSSIDAMKVFNMMLAEGSRPDAKLYHVIMRMFASLELWDKVIAIYENMKRTNVEPDDSIHMTAFISYLQLGNLGLAVRSLDEMVARSKFIGAGNELTAKSFETVLLRLSYLFRGTLIPVAELSSCFDSVYNRFHLSGVVPSKTMFEKLIKIMLKEYKLSGREYFLERAIQLCKDASKYALLGSVSSDVKTTLFNAVASSGSLLSVAEVLGAIFAADPKSKDVQDLETILRHTILAKGTDLSGTSKDSFAESLLKFWERLKVSIVECREMNSKTSAIASTGDGYQHFLGLHSPSDPSVSEIDTGLTTLLVFLLDTCPTANCLQELWRLVPEHPALPHIDESLVSVYIHNLARVEAWSAIIEAGTIEAQRLLGSVSEGFLRFVYDVLRNSGTDCEGLVYTVTSFWVDNASDKIRPLIPVSHRKQ